MFIRPATQRDYPRIPALVEAAFGQHDEALIVEGLRRADEIEMEFVATDRDELIGHLVLSRLVEPEGCLALAPVSVHPFRQKQGIGSALIEKALLRAEEEEWTAVFVYGNPRYYGRFGFDVQEANDFETVYPSEFIAARVFDESAFGSLPRDLTFSTVF